MTSNNYYMRNVRTAKLPSHDDLKFVGAAGNQMLEIV